MLSILNFFFAALLWVQVPQWSDDWSNCAVDVPDTSCHWYVANVTIPSVMGLIGRPLRGIVLRLHMLQTYDDVLAEGHHTQLNHFKMNLTSQEIEYLQYALETLNGYTSQKVNN